MQIDAEIDDQQAIFVLVVEIAHHEGVGRNGPGVDAIAALGR